MKKFKIALGIASTIAVGFLFYQIRKSNTERKLESISDAGYETAFDILYPEKNFRIRRN